MSEQNRSFKIGFVANNALVKKVAFTKGVQDVLVIGKASQCNIVFNEPIISKQHAQLIHNENNELYLIDLGSTNGTYVNGRKLEVGVPYPIQLNDDIQFSTSGTCKLTFQPDSFRSGSDPGIYGGVKVSDTGSVLGTTDIIEKVRQKGKVVIGRSPECDVELPGQNSVSRRHASIEKKGNDFILTDLGSLNGTYLNGRRISGSVKVSETDTIFIGRYQIKLKGRARDLASEVSIKAEFISKQFNNGKIGLHECSFEIPSKSLTAVMGPSGCGKSTLLKALNGDAPPSGGRVSISGLDLNENYDYLKTQIGYVPQDDIVHRELTVEQSLFYAARLRLENVDDEFLKNKIEQVLKDLNITHIRSNLVGEISGGQRKRVSIAVEILTDPLILFLDEPTSPLDPQTIEEFLGILQDLAAKGTTVMMVTHKPEDLNYMDSVIFMAEGGYLVYQGDSRDYLSYFSTQDTVKVYSELAKPKSQKWIDRRPVHGSSQGKQVASSFNQHRSVNFFSQFWWLTLRYFNIKLNDKVNTSIMIGQAPIIAGLVCLIFNNISQAVPFLMAISAVWFGTNNAAREIVGEGPIYKRERMFNQGILPYVLSKITVLGAFAAIQSFLFVLIIYCRFKGSSPQWNDPALSFVWMLMISIAASFMGLLLSALVSTTEKVMTLVPIALIPQIMLAGIVAKINNGFVEFLSYLTLARWGTEGFSIIQKEVVVPNPTMKDPEGTKIADAKTELVKQFHESYDNTFGSWHATMKLDLIVVAVISLIFFISIYLALKSKDSMKIK
jgi:ABC-type multidrug transport system ATPase subunit/pSer/pThr/pTyr-binding forkhead associated (FHA) protein/ABC-type multidrug transport system permease subunit